jgi:hypothetical protein
MIIVSGKNHESDPLVSRYSLFWADLHLTGF